MAFEDVLGDQFGFMNDFLHTELRMYLEFL